MKHILLTYAAPPPTGTGPAVVPNGIRRVPVLGGNVPPLFCARLSPPSATMLMLINVVNRKDDSFCIFPTLSRALNDRRIVGSRRGIHIGGNGKATPFRCARGRHPPPKR